MKTPNLSRIRTKELPVLTNDLIRIVEKYNPETMGVNIFFNVLKDSLPNLELLTEPLISSPLTKEIKIYRIRLLELTEAIVSQIRGVEKARLSAANAERLLISPLISMYLMNAKRQSWLDYEKNVSSFLLAIDSSEEIRNATISTGIDIYIAELIETKKQYNLNVVARRETKVTRRSIKEQAFDKVAKSNIMNLLYAIELAKVSNSSYNFKPVTTDLEVLFTSYNALFRSRSTRNYNKAIKKSVAPNTTSDATDSFDNEPV